MFGSSTRNVSPQGRGRVTVEAVEEIRSSRAEKTVVRCGDMFVASSPRVMLRPTAPTCTTTVSPSTSIGICSTERSPSAVRRSPASVPRPTDSSQRIPSSVAEPVGIEVEEIVVVARSDTPNCLGDRHDPFCCGSTDTATAGATSTSVAVPILESNDPLDTASRRFTSGGPPSRRSASPSPGVPDDLSSHPRLVGVPSNYSAVPWDQRKPVDTSSRMEHFQCCAVSPHFLQRIEHALRFTLCGILPAAALAFADKTTNFWLQPFFVVLMPIIVGEYHVGTTLMQASHCVQGSLLFLGFIELVVLINPAVHFAPWIIVFAVVVWFVAFFTEGFTSKIALFLFCGRMLQHWRGTLIVDGKEYPYMFSLRLLIPSSIGIAIGCLVPLVPFPRRNVTEADEHFSAVFSSISICFNGVCDSLYLPPPQTNTKRQINLARIRAVRSGIDFHLAALKTSVARVAWEPCTAARYARLKVRTTMVDQLLAYLDTMITFIDTVSVQPSAIDHADIAQDWLATLCPALVGSCQHVDDACQRLSDTNREYDKEIRQRLVDVRAYVNGAYSRARSNLSFQQEWYLAEDPETHFPLGILSFFLFNYGCFYTTLMQHNEDGVESGRNEPSYCWRLFIYPIGIFQRTIQDVKNLYARDKRTIGKLVEAAKLSFAMSTAIAFLMFLDVQDPVGGAVVMGFVKAADPTSNVLSSINYVLATVVGSVCGFLLASVAQDLTQRIVYMCVGALIFTFLRAGDKYRSFGLLGLFFCVSFLVPGNDTSDRLIGLIQQNVSAVLWLGLTHLAIFPLWPSREVQHELVRGISLVRTTTLDLAERIVSGVTQYDDLQLQIEQLTQSIERQKEHLSSVEEEPTLKRLPFPVSEAKRVLSGLEAARSALTPALTAAHFCLVLQEKQEKEETPTVAWAIIEGLQQHLHRVMRRFDLLARELSICLDTTSTVADLAPSLLESHERFSLAVEEMYKEVTKSFFTSFGTRKHSMLYQSPAAVTLLQFFRSLDKQMHGLVLASVEYRRLETLRI